MGWQVLPRLSAFETPVGCPLCPLPLCQGKHCWCPLRGGRRETHHSKRTEAGRLGAEGGSGGGSQGSWSKGQAAVWTRVKDLLCSRTWPHAAHTIPRVASAGQPARPPDRPVQLPGHRARRNKQGVSCLGGLPASAGSPRVSRGLARAAWCQLEARGQAEPRPPFPWQSGVRARRAEPVQPGGRRPKPLQLAACWSAGQLRGPGVLLP